MDLVREIREIFVQCIGALVACLNLFGIRASNNEFNGRTIDQYRCSALLQDEMVISQFYVYETLIRHNFVVFKTMSGQTFKVHLIADVYPKGYSPIYVEIVPTEWRPSNRYVGTCAKLAWYLKRFVENQVQIFGAYEVGFHDCRHFARAVAGFLDN